MALSMSSSGSNRWVLAILDADAIFWIFLVVQGLTVMNGTLPRRASMIDDSPSSHGRMGNGCQEESARKRWRNIP